MNPDESSSDLTHPDPEARAAARPLLTRLVMLTTETVAREAELETMLTEEQARLQDDHLARQTRLDSEYEEELQARRTAHTIDLTQRQANLNEAQRQAEFAYKAGREEVEERAQALEKDVKAKYAKAKWLSESIYESSEDQPKLKFLATKGEIEERFKEVTRLAGVAIDQLAEFRFPVVSDLFTRQAVEPEDPEAPVAPAPADPPPSLIEATQDFDTRLAELTALRLPGFFVGARVGMLVTALIVVAAVIPLWLNDWQPNLALVISAGVTALVALVSTVVLFRKGRGQVEEAILPLLAANRLARQAREVELDAAAERRQEEEAELIRVRDAELLQARTEYDAKRKGIKPECDEALRRIADTYKQRMQQISGEREKISAELEVGHDQAMAQLRADHQQQKQEAERQREESLSELQVSHDHAWRELRDRWRQETGEIYERIESARAESADLFPAWSDPTWENFRPRYEFPSAIRFGDLAVDLAALPEGLPRSEELALPGPAELALPASLPFPDHCSILVETGESGRDEAIALLQMFMIRLLTSLPPGKVRFTIIDPVGLGQNFAGFMHLADYDEAFVGGKIWTENRHIEQRLADLSEHMEHVIQKYLRNEFETIQDYNEQAGEIAEPFRFLIVADFPVNFTEAAARRLASIQTSGPRCGVHTLIHLDSRQRLPQGLQLSDLRKHSTHLGWEKDKLVWQDEAHKHFPLRVDPVPPDQLLTSVLNTIGRAALEAGPVQVPFHMIAPSADEAWTESSAESFRIPLGRAGAKKLQYMTLGRGTAQHVLIAGKTGSGKSTLLHAIVSSAALWYSPSEIELYLVDFKKGVEFKAYAGDDFPHARVVAIESDREFGLSVLQRLDAELKRRGDLFRNLGAQDVAAYRRLAPEDRMPRILLIVDEFQEFFVEDDKVGQDASLLMDRLVRQGRAFGIHVLLGSQTLAGAYSLARSTIGQMAVRVALQCSEADSYLIMNDENSAARLLSRPGEAIYNDASGAVEGNSPFQVTWISEADRQMILERVAASAKTLEPSEVEGQIVFEGNVPADLRKNGHLAHLLKDPAPTSAPSALAYLGEAIAIKDPTAVNFRRQGGANMLMVGQRDDIANDMLAATMLGLAIQQGDAKFVVLDGSPPGRLVCRHVGALDGAAPQRHAPGWLSRSPRGDAGPG